MNQQLEQLAALCGFVSNPDIYTRQSFDVEKFGQLVVKACAGLVSDSPLQRERIMGHFGVSAADNALNNLQQGDSVAQFKPKWGQEYWYPTPTMRGLVGCTTWQDSPFDYLMQERNMVFATAEPARAATEMMLQCIIDPISNSAAADSVTKLVADYHAQQLQHTTLTDANEIEHVLNLAKTVNCTSVNYGTHSVTEEFTHNNTTYRVSTFVDGSVDIVRLDAQEN